MSQISKDFLKKVHISGPVQLKPMLFKGQLYIKMGLYFRLPFIWVNGQFSFLWKKATTSEYLWICTNLWLEFAPYNWICLGLSTYRYKNGTHKEKAPMSMATHQVILCHQFSHPGMIHIIPKHLFSCSLPRILCHGQSSRVP